MLTDPVEIEIISKAKQKNVRRPERSRVHFDNIFEHFLKNADFDGKVFLDMGPGQFDFGVLARERGGDVISIDNDPAVVALGKYKGLTCLEADLRDLSQLEIPEKLDGIFCKFSISAFWFDKGAQAELTKTLNALLKPDGWIWIAPWNGAPSDSDATDVQGILKHQIDAFNVIGCDAWELSETATRHFGVRGGVENNILFTKGVQIPDDAGLLRKIPSDSPMGTGEKWPSPKTVFEQKNNRTKGRKSQIIMLLDKILLRLGIRNAG